MLKNVIKMMLGLALFAAAVPAAAGPLLTQEFWAKDSANNDVKFGSLTVDADDAVLDGGVYVVNVWKSFTLFGVEMVKPPFLFYSVINKNNLFDGFDVLSFDVSDSNNIVAFWGFFDKQLGVGFSELFFLNANGGFDGYVFDPDSISTRFSVVSAPATAVLMLLALAGLQLRRRQG